MAIIPMFPFFLDDSDYSRAPYEVMMKIRNGIAWSTAKEKILQVLQHYQVDALFEDGRFKEKRKFAGIPAIIIGTIAFLLTVGAVLQGSVRIIAPASNGWLVLLNLILVFMLVPSASAVATGFVWAALFKYHDVDWINVEYGHRFVYVGFKDDSKTWLARFIDDLQDAGVAMEGGQSGNNG
jgi:hypothetical protein